MQHPIIIIKRKPKRTRTRKRIVIKRIPQLSKQASAPAPAPALVSPAPAPALVSPAPVSVSPAPAPAPKPAPVIPAPAPAPALVSPAPVSVSPAPAPAPAPAPVSPVSPAPVSPALAVPSYTPGIYNADSSAENLMECGYVVLPLLGVDYARSKWMQTKRVLENMIDSFPEFKPNTKKYVMGGFSAFGNPSSFHHPFILKLRQWSLSYLYPLFTSYDILALESEITDRPRNLEALPDRFMARPPGDQPGPKSWHRDTSPHGSKGDDIFGGWINMDNKNQYFSVVPGSHTLIDPSGGGFDKPNSKNIQEAEKNKIRIVIPPGHILVFFQNMLHEIYRVKASYWMYRLFTCFRLTYSIKPLTKNLNDLISNQAVLPLKGGSFPPMYARNHEICWLTKLLVPWSESSLRSECMQTITRKSGKLKGQSFRIVQRFMKSLTELGLPLYPEYKQEDIDCMKPHRSHRLLKPGNNIEYQTFSLI